MHYYLQLEKLKIYWNMLDQKAVQLLPHIKTLQKRETIEPSPYNIVHLLSNPPWTLSSRNSPNNILDKLMDHAIQFTFYGT